MNTALATPDEGGHEESPHPYLACYEDPRLDGCHCGAPVYVNDDIEPGWTRGLCRACDLVRCDAPTYGGAYPCYENPGLLFEDTDHGDQLAIQLQEGFDRRD